MNIKELSLNLKKKALEEGFAVASIASIPGSSRINLRTKALNRWLENNFHSDMKWMETEKRKHIGLILEDAKSVLAVGFNYLSDIKQNKTNFKIGKFGQGEDYHNVIKKKLKNVGQWLEKEDLNCKWKICVDTSPLLEKAWAEESGLGWIGKNSNLINKDYGSWLTLGFLILDTKLQPDKPAQSMCGQCEKCIELCPTNAITEPFVVNAKSCIAYHTIENRNKEIPKKIQENLNGWVAGCDICQDVCPWNKSVPTNNSFEVKPKEWMNKLDQKALLWDDNEWSKNLKGTTLKRIKPWMWKRNIEAVIKN